MYVLCWLCLLLSTTLITIAGTAHHLRKVKLPLYVLYITRMIKNTYIPSFDMKLVLYRASATRTSSGVRRGTKMCFLSDVCLLAVAVEARGERNEFREQIRPGTCTRYQI
jgi:hypothetical protein